MLRSVEGQLGVDHPFFLPELLRPGVKAYRISNPSKEVELFVGIRFCQIGEKLSAKHTAEMVQQVLAPGTEYGEEAEPATQDIATIVIPDQSFVTSYGQSLAAFKTCE